MTTSAVDYINCVIAGSPATGKTSLMRRFFDHSINRAHEPTIGYTKALRHVYDMHVDMDITDLSGSALASGLEHYVAAFKNVDVVFIVVDVTAPSTFDDVASWQHLCRARCSAETLFFLVANKVDAPEAITQLDRLVMANSYDLIYTETSAAKNDGVSELFKLACRHVLRQRSDSINEMKAAYAAATSRRRFCDASCVLS